MLITTKITRQTKEKTETKIKDMQEYLRIDLPQWITGYAKTKTN